MLLHLISHCNSCLQALLPETSTQACHLSPHDSSDAHTAGDKAADRAAESAAAPAAAPSSSGVAQAGAQAGSEAATAAAGPTQLVQSLVLEGPVGQALAEATVEMVLAVLRGSEDSGQLLMRMLYLCAHDFLDFACYARHIELRHSSLLQLFELHST